MWIRTNLAGLFCSSKTMTGSSHVDQSERVAAHALKWIPCFLEPFWVPIPGPEMSSDIHEKWVWTSKIVAFRRTSSAVKSASIFRLPIFRPHLLRKRTIHILRANTDLPSSSSGRFWIPARPAQGQSSAYFSNISSEGGAMPFALRILPLAF